jgi:hypothetical protein
VYHHVGRRRVRRQSSLRPFSKSSGSAGIAFSRRWDARGADGCSHRSTSLTSLFARFSIVQRHPRWKAALATIGLDLLLTGSMLALFSFNLTGLRLHEWLGLGLCILLPVHMLVNWSWLASTTRLLLSSLPWRVRLRYLLNASLFVAIVVVTLSGLVISEAVFPSLPASVGNPSFWHQIHTLASNLTLVLVGLHLGVYWRNVVNLVGRIISGGRRDARARVPAGAVRSRMGV